MPPVKKFRQITFSTWHHQEVLTRKTSIIRWAHLSPTLLSCTQPRISTQIFWIRSVAPSKITQTKATWSIIALLRLLINSSREVTGAETTPEGPERLSQTTSRPPWLNSTISSSMVVSCLKARRTIIWLAKRKPPTTSPSSASHSNSHNLRPSNNSNNRTSHSSI